MHDQTELPKYKCTKIVEAFQIGAIVLDESLAAAENRDTTGGAILHPIMAESTTIAPIEVDRDFVSKRLPDNPLYCVGGYLVLYKDGYKSWSPAEAFEDGYIRLEK